ncbi:MAG: DNA phosphorothioation-associated putative methyltransferase, partial [Myxococcales bacterium]|nr:DNA phosphorothioation-associated putative methyltransferase [Myxococcales bacterium]
MAEISRGATAMRRTSWSRPIALALDHGLLEGRSVLDYGCGHGDDFRSLRELGIDAVGWDPEHLPEGDRRESEVVNLGFVLNVVEDQRERGEVLRRAHALATKLLIVSVRVDRSLNHAERYADGVITTRNT